jgi:membrane-associated phospholipid phosphatase
MKHISHLTLLTLLCLFFFSAQGQNNLKTLHNPDKLKWHARHSTATAYLKEYGDSRSLLPAYRRMGLGGKLSNSYAPSLLPLDYSKFQDGDEDYTRKGHRNRLLRISVAPAALMGLGLFMNKDDGLLNREDFRDVWNTLFPDFNDDVDDIAQFYPPVLVYLAKIGGLKGRSSYARSATALGISAFLAGSMVFGLKEVVEAERPETTMGKSFPSGHTTTAFVGATFMHKELGVISPIYSVVAYTLAVIVGVYRQLNDLHWISDVLFGAGVGILSTELGYMITDDIYGNKGLNPEPVRRFFDKPMYKPSFLMYKLGYAQLIGDVDEIQDLGIDVRSGFSFGNEVTYFFNSWLGIGSEIAVGSFPINTSGYELQDPSLQEVTEEIQSDAVGVFSAYFGPYFNFNLYGNNKVSLIYKAAVGYTEGAEAGVKARLLDEYQDDFGAKEIRLLTYDPDRTFGFGTTLFLRVLLSRVIGVSTYVNYNSSNPIVEVTEVTSVDPATGTVNRQVVFDDNQQNNFFSVGFSIVGMLWGGNFGN